MVALCPATPERVPAVRRSLPNRPVYSGLGSSAESDIGDLSRLIQPNSIAAAAAID